MKQLEIPTIIAFSQDAEFLHAIKQGLFPLNIRLISFQDRSELEKTEPSLTGFVSGEPLMGSGYRLIDTLSALQPALILFDLDNPAIPWQKWLPLIKSVSATRRLPLVCTSAALLPAERVNALELGADGVYDKVLDQKVINEWLGRHARFLDAREINENCAQPLSALAVQGLQLFNHGEYFEAHEILEEAWNQDQSTGREMYRAILQIAVAYLQIERGNYQGALKMFLRVRQWIQPLPDYCRGVNISQLRQDSLKVYEQMIELGEDRLAEFDRSLFKPVEYQENR